MQAQLENIKCPNYDKKFPLLLNDQILKGHRSLKGGMPLRCMVNAGLITWAVRFWLNLDSQNSFS